MRVSEHWLRDFVALPVSAARLAQQLTMAGLEVDAIEPAAPPFEGVQVARILRAAPHPNADRLQVCTVDVGEAEPLQIVCGAANARAGLMAPLARVGAVLPGDFRIALSDKRGVVSHGMLCSAAELGLAEAAEGLLELPADAPVGAPLRQYLALDDTILDVDLTPNRADCLSVLGIAREAALLNRLPLVQGPPPEVPVLGTDSVPVRVALATACPRYLGRLVSGLDSTAKTPLWMVERLRRAGLRSLGPVVDATNYVLLELGQPMHAFDADRLQGGIQVRWGREGERLELLDGSTVELAEDVLVIADEAGAAAMAGVMGGARTAVGAGTRRIFLEAAYFAPSAIQGRARRHGLQTDSSQRFERGVDPQLPRRAMERATALILEIAGGTAGPVVECSDPVHLPERPWIELNHDRLNRMLGLSLEPLEIEEILLRLGMRVEPHGTGCRVQAPSFRFDVAIEADLYEEVARVYGYDELPRRQMLHAGRLGSAPEDTLSRDRIKDLLVDRGYQETITYSFVPESMVAAITPEAQAVPLRNPLSAELAVMRTSLWCSLLQVALWNRNRQQERLRLFETGLRFAHADGGIEQTPSLAGLVSGPVWEEQWASPARPADFYDVKGDVEALLALSGQGTAFRFVASGHPALHPGQSAQIVTPDGCRAGWLGMLHPRLEAGLGFETPIYLYELDLSAVTARVRPAYQGLSRFPSVRRDLALVMDATVEAGVMTDAVAELELEALRQLRIFDVYVGPGVPEGKKSLALGLTFQLDDETLTDAAVDAYTRTVIEHLGTRFGATLRS